MIRLFQALGRSLLDLFNPRMLMLLLLPPVAALLLWGILGYVFWAQILSFAQFFGEKFLFIREIPHWATEWFAVTPDGVATALAGFLALLLILPMTILTSMLVTSVVVMPVVVQYMGKKFPHLEKRGRGVVIASTQNLVISSVLYIVLWLLSLPLWMIPGMSFALPLLLNGYLNYRLFAFDSLADFASPREVKFLMKKKRIDFILMGTIVSALVLIPPLFLILPIYSALCFARYGLMELNFLRTRTGAL